MNWQESTKLLLGDENVAKLKQANVLIVGLGGVGAYAAEQLCRAGIGKMTIADGDVVEATNINRQLPALTSTIGKTKTEILAARFMDINPELKLTIIHDYINGEKTAELIKSQPFDYVVDAIDTLAPKVFLIYHAMQAGLKLISSMGAGGKIDPTNIDIVDISAIDKELWLPRIKEADVLFFEGGSDSYLMKWITKSGLEDILPDLLKNKVYVGVSAGSMVTGKKLLLKISQDIFEEDFKIDSLRIGIGIPSPTAMVLP